jgi:YbbR domain-containing protein
MGKDILSEKSEKRPLSVRFSINKTNIFVAILSVFLALILWFYVMGVDSPSVVKTFTSIPVEIIENGNSGLSIYYGYNNIINISVEGKNREIGLLKQGDISAYVDASHITLPGRYTLDVKVTLPENMALSLSEQTLNSISVYLDKKSTTVVPVKAVLVNYSLEDGFQIMENEIKLDYEEITVSGPETTLSAIDHAQINLSLGAIRNTTELAVTPELIDTSGEKIVNPYVKMSLDTIVAVVPVFTFKDVALRVDFKYNYFNNNNININISPDHIKIKGEPNVLNDIDSISVYTIDEKTQITDEIILDSIPLPDKVTNVNPINQVSIGLVYKGVKTQNLKINDIIVHNLSLLNYTLESGYIDITVRGDTNSLNYITENDIDAVINLNSVENIPGVVTVPITFEFSDAFKNKVYELGEYYMSVIIS